MSETNHDEKRNTDLETELAEIKGKFSFISNRLDDLISGETKTINRFAALFTVVIAVFGISGIISGIINYKASYDAVEAIKLQSNASIRLVEEKIKELDLELKKLRGEQGPNLAYIEAIGENGYERSGKVALLSASLNWGKSTGYLVRVEIYLEYRINVIGPSGETLYVKVNWPKDIHETFLQMTELNLLGDKRLAEGILSKVESIVIEGLGQTATASFYSGYVECDKAEETLHKMLNTKYEGQVSVTPVFKKAEKIEEGSFPISLVPGRFTTCKKMQEYIESTKSQFFASSNARIENIQNNEANFDLDQN